MAAALALMLLAAGYQYGGTFIGAVICSDGVVIAADSRTTFIDSNGKPFAYLDGMPKIYAGRDTSIAVSGLSSVDGELFSSFVNRNRDLLLRRADEIMFGFLLWLPFTNSNNVSMISAGYVDGKPMICAKSPILPQNCLQNGFMTSKSSPLLRDTFSGFGRLPTANEAIAALKSAIEESSKTDLSVGGPMSILKLTNAAPPQWSGPPPISDGLTHICDLVRTRRGAIVPIGNYAELGRYLDAICPGPKGK